MKTYRLADRNALVVSVNHGAWEKIVFRSRDFADIRKATAAEIAAVLNRSPRLEASGNAHGALVIETAARGGHTALTVDLGHSTAAGALGLGVTHAQATGAGLRAAQLMSLNAGPFSLRAGDALTVAVDGRKKKAVFGRGVAGRKGTVDAVVKAINRAIPAIASAGRDGHVILTSPTIGLKSSLEVTGTGAAGLGFTGAAAVSRPHNVEAARLECAGESSGLTAVNLTAAPIELHFATGTAVLPARGSLPVAPIEAAHAPLQRLIQQGAVRLRPEFPK